MWTWYGPAGRDFFDSIYGTLQNGQEHCAVVIPEIMQRDFRTALLKFANEGYGEIRIITLDPEKELLDNLKSGFCKPDEAEDKIVNYAGFAESHLREGHFLAITFPGNIENWRREYHEFLRWAATDAKRRKDSGEPLNWSMLCILPPGHGFQPETGMTLRNWWGRNFPSDLEFAIERALRPQKLGFPAYTWYYAICKGLGNAAPDLVESLAQAPLRDFKSIMNVLVKHPLCNQESARLAKKYGIPKCDRDNPPPNRALELWKASALDIGCLDEPLLHPAVLAACDFKNRIFSMVVAGQMQVYLPLAQQVFQKLMNRIAQKLGENWEAKYDNAPDSLGKLAWLLGTHFPEDLSVELALADQWKNVRNTIAHGKFIPMPVALLAVASYRKLLDSEIE